jgi:dTDP-4-dehydrorhamnose 3,5-epimerase-like enzyme
MEGLQIVSLKKLSSIKGSLIAAESGKDFSFLSKRIFFITSNKGDKRGRHAHKEHSQFMICAQGSCSLTFTNGFEKENILLKNNDIGVEVKPGIWGEQEYLEDNTVLIVLSDFHFDENDYLRDYDDFKSFISNKSL